MTSHHIDVGDVTIHVEEDGSGQPTVLLHGFTGCASAMADLGNLLGQRRQLRFDLIGHGQSSAPADVGHYTMESTVTHVAGAITHLSAEPVDLVGYSFGGRVALSLMASRPDLIRRAALISATPGLPTVRQRFDRTTNDRALADDIEQNGLEAFVDRWMSLPMWDSLRTATSVEQWNASRDQRLSGTTIGYANSLRGAGTGAMPPLHDRLPTLETPTRLIAGRLDTKFVTAAREMETLLPSADFRMVQAAGHATHLEKPADVASLIRDALS